MKILILGSNGQLGSYLRYVNNSSSNLDLILFDKNKFNLLKGEDFKILSKVDFDYCLNCSAFTDVNNAEINPDDAMAVNGFSLKKLSLTLNELNKPLIHISTDFVFDGKQQNYTPECRTNPLNAYGRSKLLGEQMIQTYSNNFIIIRTSWLFGSVGINFFTKIKNLIEQGKNFRVVKDEIGTPTYAADLAEAIFKLIITHSDRPLNNKIYHYAGLNCISRHEFALEIQKSLSNFNKGFKALTIEPTLAEEYYDGIQRPKNSCLDSSMFNTHFSANSFDLQSSLARLAKDHASLTKFLSL